MALKSRILAGNTRLELAFAGGPAIRRKPPTDDADAVGRIQKGLVALGYPMPDSFPRGYDAEPDCDFEGETYNTVIAFQNECYKMYLVSRVAVSVRLRSQR